MSSTSAISWTYFVNNIFADGKRKSDPAKLEPRIEEAIESIRSCWQPREDGPVTRPSSGLACARVRHLRMVKGVVPHKPSEAARITWAIGHMLHYWVYGCIESAAPAGLEVEIEHTRQLPEWWPKHLEGFAQDGHTDMVLRAPDPAAIGLPGCGSNVLIDLKSTNQSSYGSSKKPWEEPDAFGYLSQLAVYSDGGKAYDHTFLGYLNRNNPAAPSSEIKLVLVPDEVLAQEKQRLIAMFERGWDEDPGPEMYERWGSKVAWSCGRFCDVRDGCDWNGEVAVSV